MLGFAVSNEALIVSAILSAGAIVLGVAVQRVAFLVLERTAKRRPEDVLLRLFIAHLQRPAAYIIPLIFLLLTVPNLPFASEIRTPIEQFLRLMVITTMGWLAVAALGFATDLIVARQRIDVSDNLRARRIETRVRIVGRTLATIILVLTIGGMLMTFPAVRAIGTTLLASAGIAGLAAGLAARPLFENIVAGLQIALTQPIRIDDAVVVNGEFGNVEEIGSTYVVIRVWDLRRLIVPLSYFITNPFENWTRERSQLIGTVLLFVDYTVHVDEVRAELERIVKSAPLWDGATWNLQVVDATERSMQLRILVSAGNAGDAWDLRCYVREKLIAFLQQRYPDALPRVRIDTGLADGSPTDQQTAAGAVAES